MSAPTVSKEQAIAEAYALLSRALGRIVQDEAAGRLPPEAMARIARLRAKYASEPTAASAA